jgi:hypothetical protein
VTVFELEPAQIKLIDLWFRCRDNSHNHETPYFFELTQHQRQALKLSAPIAPTKFAISSSFNGDVGSELTANVINRFSESQFEIAHSLLLNQIQSEEWQSNTIGWSLESRYSNLSEGQLKSVGCPGT